MKEIAFTHHAKLAWALLVLLVLSLLMFAVLPAWSYSQELSDKIETGYRQLTKMRQIATTTPEFMAEYERVKSQGLDKLFYSAGMTNAQVAKELQKQVTEVIIRGNGQILSSEVVEEQQTETEAETAQSGYERVTVRVTFQGSMPLVRQVLHQAYQARPLIFVDGLELYPIDQEGNPTAQLAKAEVLITTYWRGGGNHEKVD